MGLTFTLTSTGGTITMDGSLDGAGCKWWATVTGWDSPDLSYDTTTKANDHGLFPGLSLYGGRQITVAGVTLAPDVTTLRAARDRLDLLAQAGVDVTLTSVEGRSITGRLSGALLKKSISEQQAQFSIPLLCADPFKYGAGHSNTLALPVASDGAFFPLYFPLALSGDNTTVTVANNGTRAAAPLVTFIGPVVNPSITLVNTGQWWGFDITLAATDRLVADASDGSVLMNGTPARWVQDPASQPFWLPSGTCTLAFNAGAYSSAAVCTVAFSDTYL